MRIRDPGRKKIRHQDPGLKKFGSGTRIRNTAHTDNNYHVLVLPVVTKGMQTKRDSVTYI
jgi:hypothetical protein